MSLDNIFEIISKISIPSVIAQLISVYLNPFHCSIRYEKYNNFLMRNLTVATFGQHFAIIQQPADQFGVYLATWSERLKKI